MGDNPTFAGVFIKKGSPAHKTFRIHAVSEVGMDGCLTNRCHVIPFRRKILPKIYVLTL